MENVRTQPRRKKGLIGWLIVFAMVIAAFIFGRYYEDIRAWAAAQFGSGSAPSAARSGQAAQTDPELAAARVLFESRRYDKAREQLSALSARNPETAEVRFWLGRTHYELKEYPEAIKQLEEAARLDPQWPDVHLHLARAYEAVGDRQKMQESLRRATAR